MAVFGISTWNFIVTPLSKGNIGEELVLQVEGGAKACKTYVQELFLNFHAFLCACAKLGSFYETIFLCT